MRARLAANTLLDRFGTFQDVLAADRRHIADVLPWAPQVGPLLAAVKDAVAATLSADLAYTDHRTTCTQLVAFLNHKIALEPVEVLYVFYFDPGGRLILDEEAARGDYREVGSPPKEIARRALQVGAAQIIIAHNHPAGDPRPSHADHNFTRAVSDACRVIDTGLADHLIIARNGFVSLRDAGARW